MEKLSSYGNMLYFLLYTSFHLTSTPQFHFFFHNNLKKSNYKKLFQL